MAAKQWMVAGAMSAFFAVALGAFGAHGLKNSLSEQAMAIYQTAVQYHFIHALALLIFGLWMTLSPAGGTSLPGQAFLGGIFLFSGSLYALAVTDLKFLGMITPLGGVLFLVGWIAFAFQVWKA